MTESLVTEPIGAEEADSCPCCGRPIYEGTGWLLEGESEKAFYVYRWAEGHEVAFSLAVAGTVGEHMRNGFVAISCRQEDSNLNFSVYEAADSPWGDTDEFGPLLSRAQALDPEGLYPDLWGLVDRITELEPRLADRISFINGP
jgi:hypothetical protein